jgi:hypothetical protein
MASAVLEAGLEAVIAATIYGMQMSQLAACVRLLCDVDEGLHFWLVRNGRYVRAGFWLWTSVLLRAGLGSDVMVGRSQRE